MVRLSTNVDRVRHHREAGVRPLMGSAGDVQDNAMCASFFTTLELIDRRRFRTQVESRIAIFAFIEGFHDPRRRDGTCSKLVAERSVQFVHFSLIIWKIFWQSFRSKYSMPSVIGTRSRMREEELMRS
jgi:transposase InsO family protein